MATFPNQRRFDYEYGQRWAVRLPVPRSAHLCQPFHCAEPEDKVMSEVRELCERSREMQGCNSRLIPQCERYALCVFRNTRRATRKLCAVSSISRSRPMRMIRDEPAMVAESVPDAIRLAGALPPT
jgi:hypothetical protein